MTPATLFVVDFSAVYCVLMGSYFCLTLSWWTPVGALMLLVPAVLALEHRRLRHWAWGFYSLLPVIPGTAACQHWAWLGPWMHVLDMTGFGFVVFICLLRLWHRRCEVKGKAPFHEPQAKCFATLWGY